MADFVSGDELEMLAQAELFNAKTAGAPDFYDLSAADVTALADLITTANATVATANVKDAEKQAAVAAKNTAVNAVEVEFRKQAKDARNKDGITEAELNALGLDEYDTSPTPIGVPTTRPIGNVETAQRLEHRIEFVDETSTTTSSNAKPDGVASCFIFRKIDGAPPVDVSECSFLAQDTGSPYLATYTGADAGKTVYYILRWANPKGEMGPISETIAATVTG